MSPQYTNCAPASQGSWRSWLTAWPSFSTATVPPRSGRARPLSRFSTTSTRCGCQRRAASSARGASRSVRPPRPWRSCGHSSRKRSRTGGLARPRCACRSRPAAASAPGRSASRSSTSALRCSSHLVCRPGTGNWRSVRPDAGCVATQCSRAARRWMSSSVSSARLSNTRCDTLAPASGGQATARLPSRALARRQRRPWPAMSARASGPGSTRACGRCWLPRRGHCTVCHCTTPGPGQACQAWTQARTPVGRAVASASVGLPRGRRQGQRLVASGGSGARSQAAWPRW